MAATVAATKASGGTSDSYWCRHSFKGRAVVSVG
jgi:hypothetical protein